MVYIKSQMGAGNACLFLLKVPQRQITSGEAGAFDAGLQRLSGLPGFGDKPAIEGAFTPAAGSLVAAPAPAGLGPGCKRTTPRVPPGRLLPATRSNWVPPAGPCELGVLRCSCTPRQGAGFSPKCHPSGLELCAPCPATSLAGKSACGGISGLTGTHARTTGPDSYKIRCREGQREAHTC